MKDIQRQKIGRTSNGYFKEFFPQFFDDESQRYIFDRYQQFVDDPSSRVAALIQKPLIQTNEFVSMGRLFGLRVRENLDILNQINLGNIALIQHSQVRRNMIILYLVNVEYILCYTQISQAEKQEKLRDRKMNIKVVMKLCDAPTLVRSVQDGLFALEHPKSYVQYSCLFDLITDGDQNIENKVKKCIDEMLCENGIEAEIQSRIKTMTSVHGKIKKKNILPLQVSDIVGLRIIVNTTEDCYRLLMLIVDKWSVHHAKIKDYIAVPKDNGYQSIHVTILVDGRTVEMQIRTHEMHYNAQYGHAAHHLYKNKK